MGNRSASAFAGLTSAAALLGLLGCTSGDSPNRVIVLGLDGIDPETVALLVSEGKMPHFARLAREGAQAKLESEKPLLSPILWTTIATGKPPHEHGIGHFVAVNEQTGERLPVTGEMRAVKAIWNIASAHQRRVGVVGWWATWPAESVRGTMVSDHTCYHFLFPEGESGARDSTGLVHPPGLWPRIAEMVRRPGDLGLSDVRRFARVSATDMNRPFAFDDPLGHLRWALATTESYTRIGHFLWNRDRPDLLMVYVEGTDSASHLFGHLFRARNLAGELAEQQERFGETVEEMYAYADEIVGSFMREMDEHTSLVVLSDHGFELGALPDDPSKLRDMRRVSERFHRPEGILYLYGADVRAGAAIRRPTLLDITPTLLALLGIPAAADMPGRVLDEALELDPPERSVASYESADDGASRPRAQSEVDPAILEHLRSLGYLDAESPAGDRNLAALRFEKGDHEEAARRFAALVRENPRDGALRASLAGAYGALGRFAEALEQLEEAERLAPLNPETYHNRGAIYERLGRAKEAVAQYRRALRYAPGYRPSQQALRRLTGSDRLLGPLDDKQRRATRLAQQAAADARRGDYSAALDKLTEAGDLAPGLAVVHQYRANVAFLMGDRDAAIRALEKGLQIEPDNALFRANLQHLRQQSAAREAGSEAPPGDHE